jgi:hypothetical protein
VRCACLHRCNLNRAHATTALTRHACGVQRSAGPVDLHTVAANPARPEQFTVGGEEEYAYVYDARAVRAHASGRGTHPVVEPLQQHVPRHLLSARAYSDTHITASVFSQVGELLVTYSNEAMYLFHPWRAGRSPRVRAAQASSLQLCAVAFCVPHERARCFDIWPKAARPHASAKLDLNSGLDRWITLLSSIGLTGSGTWLVLQNATTDTRR